MAAAVADFAPVQAAGHKLKKRDGVPVVELRPTVDILAELGRRRSPDQTLVGFAAETDDLVSHATTEARLEGTRPDRRQRRRRLPAWVSNTTPTKS